MGSKFLGYASLPVSNFPGLCHLVAPMFTSELFNTLALGFGDVTRLDWAVLLLSGSNQAFVQ
jgi:hypothetical protein